MESKGAVIVKLLVCPLGYIASLVRLVVTFNAPNENSTQFLRILREIPTIWV